MSRSAFEGKKADTVALRVLPRMTGGSGAHLRKPQKSSSGRTDERKEDSSFGGAQRSTHLEKEKGNSTERQSLGAEWEISMINWNNTRDGNSRAPDEQRLTLVGERGSGEWCYCLNKLSPTSKIFEINANTKYSRCVQNKNNDAAIVRRIDKKNL